MRAHAELGRWSMVGGGGRRAAGGGGINCQDVKIRNFAAGSSKNRATQQHQLSFSLYQPCRPSRNGWRTVLLLAPSLFRSWVANTGPNRSVRATTLPYTLCHAVLCTSHVKTCPRRFHLVDFWAQRTSG